MLKAETMEFGIPKKEVKVDPYEGKALLIMHPAPTGNKGKAYRFELTKLAVEQLGLVKTNNEDEKLVSFSFSEGILIANTTSMKGTLDSGSQYNVNMNGGFSNKNAHDFIAQLLTLDITTETLFNIVLDNDDNSDPNFPAAKLVLQKEGTAEEELTTKVHLDEVDEIAPVNVEETIVDDAIPSNDNF